MRDILAGGVLVQSDAMLLSLKGHPRRTAGVEERRSVVRRRASKVHDVRIQPGQLVSPGIILSYASLSLH